MQTNQRDEFQTTTSQIEIACDLMAIPADERATHITTAQQLFARAAQVTELESGIEFTLPSASATLLQAAQFIDHERECCPFFTFTLEVKPSGEPLHLRLTGGDGVKEMLLSEFGDKLAVTNLLPAQHGAAESL